MKDSYDPLDWGNSSNQGGIEKHSADEYDQYASNPTYRNDFYDDSQGMGDAYQDSYQQYDQSGSDYYQQDYQYDMGSADYSQQDYQSYDNGYNNGYDNGYQQPQSIYNDPQMATGPVRYSQADYDNMAQNPTYIENPNRMDADEFFDMVNQQQKRERQREIISDIALSGTAFRSLNSHYGESPDISKDLLLYLLFAAFGAAMARLFSLPLWLYPLFAALIAYGVTMIKKIVIEDNPPKDAFKLAAIEGALVGVGLIASIVMYAKGF